MSGRKKETRSPRRETPPRLRFLEGASAQTGRGGGGLQTIGHTRTWRWMRRCPERLSISEEEGSGTGGSVGRATVPALASAGEVDESRSDGG